jgi:tetratricopeptide (TPR) repeat protein
MRTLGHLSEASPFFERAILIVMELEVWINASIGYGNLGDVYIQLGDLASSTEAFHQAFALARRSGNKDRERNALAKQAQAEHLRGDVEAAGQNYQLAEALEREIDPDKRYLYSVRGINCADHLHRNGQLDYARRVTEANLEICDRNHWVDIISRCHRLLGDLDSDEGNHTNAREHYDQALKIARGITRRDVLIEALLARGRWKARYHQDRKGLEQTFADLDEALGYAQDGGYRIFEADTRIALAWAQLANGEISRVMAEAEHAQRMSGEMGYYWGQVDADEILAALKYEG